MNCLEFVILSLLVFCLLGISLKVWMDLQEIWGVK